MRKKTFFKIFVYNILIIILFTFTSARTNAISVGSATRQAAGILEERYHLNLGSMQNQGEYFNVSDQKKLGPELVMNFSPTDPKPGQELTAKAYPMYFETNREKLYYTWYLKKNGCNLNGSNISECDADGDGKITIEDWKVEATRIIANSVIEQDEIEFDSDDDTDGFEYIDGTVAIYGGAVKRQTPERCYIIDRNTGEQHELLGSGSLPSGTGSPGGIAGGSTSGDFGCSINQTARCVSVGITPPGCSTPNCFSHPAPDYTAIEPDCDKELGVPSCLSGTPYCVNLDYVLDPGLTADPTYCHNDYNYSDTNLCSGVGTKITSCTGGDGGGGGNYANSGCQHLFPNAPDEVTGDGEYELDEEKFWITDPHNDDTANTGNGDEANIVGMGIDQFTWNYQLGDEVGLVIEGTSQIPTKYDEHSKMIMWAFSKNDCPVTDKGTYYPWVKGYNVKIHTTKMDLNSCIERNLIDPREGGQKENIDVELTYSPDKPMNNSKTFDTYKPSDDPNVKPDDPEVKNTSLGYGEILTVSSSLSNSNKDESHIFYDWQVFISSDGSFNPKNYVRENDPEETGDEGTAGWKDITKQLVDYKRVDRVKGNDISDLLITLNLTDTLLEEVGLSVDKAFPPGNGGFGHLRVKLKVREQFTPDVSADGIATLIIQVNNSGERLVSSIAQLDDNTPATFEDNPQALICDDPLSLAYGVCYVTKNEVIAVMFDEMNGFTDYSWELNGEPLLCDDSISKNQCENDTQTRFNFFPVTGKPGTRHVVTVSAMRANQEESTGQTKTLTQVYEVVDPFLEIMPVGNEDVWPKYLGSYQNADDDYFPDISTEVFQGYTMRTAYLEAVFFPDFLKKKAKKQWLCSSPYCEEENMEDGSTANPKVFFPMLDPPGSTYSVSMEALYHQDRKIREAMERIWNMNILETTDYWIKKPIQIEVIEDIEQEDIALLTPGGFFASIVSNAPKHIWFATQALLSILVSVFLLGVIYSFGQSKRSL